MPDLGRGCPQVLRARRLPLFQLNWSCGLYGTSQHSTFSRRKLSIGLVKVIRSGKIDRHGTHGRLPSLRVRKAKPTTASCGFFVNQSSRTSFKTAVAMALASEFTRPRLPLRQRQPRHNWDAGARPSHIRRGSACPADRRRRRRGRAATAASLRAARRSSRRKSG